MCINADLFPLCLSTLANMQDTVNELHTGGGGVDDLAVQKKKKKSQPVADKWGVIISTLEKKSFTILHHFSTTSTGVFMCVCGHAGATVCHTSASANEY